MHASDERESPPSERPDGAGVLAKLPRSRPQRASPRRAAARKAAGANVAASGSPGGNTNVSGERDVAATGKRRVKASTRTRKPPIVEREPVPRQGYEADGEGLEGSVQPPGGAELFASAVEIVGELTKSGVARGERAVKDLLSRLSPS